uniref:UDP-N-acetylmuramate--L-alanine ligase n=1 Tax=Schistosoma curassoni TaxID=6186 RepID=A0A183KMF5_9TREM
MKAATSPYHDYYEMLQLAKVFDHHKKHYYKDETNAANVSAKGLDLVVVVIPTNPNELDFCKLKDR